MRIRISHATTYHYDTPPKSVTQVLRLTPRNHDGQYVVNWRIDLSQDCQLHQRDGAFGNISHVFTAEGPFDELSVTVEGEVDTQDTNGIVTGAVERFPPALFLRDTDLTEPDAAIIEFAEATRADAGKDPLDAAACADAGDQRRDDLRHRSDPGRRPPRPKPSRSSAASARTAPISSSPRRAISAFRRAISAATSVATDDVTAQDAGHAWAEAYVDKLGWVGFDPTNGISPTEAHVRVAVGLDYLGAAPVRGTRYGGGGETLKVAVNVDQAGTAIAAVAVANRNSPPTFQRKRPTL